MIVVVETNFILELALRQAEVEQVEAIVRMAEAKQIQLAIPAIAFAEAYAMLDSQARRRKKLNEELRSEIKQLVRSPPYTELEQASKAITAALVSSETVHTNDLAKTIERLRACAVVIPLSTEAIKTVTYLDLIVDLRSGDAFIYASLRDFLQVSPETPKLFVTRDKDFLKKTEALMTGMSCRFVLGFPAAVAALRTK